MDCTIWLPVWLMDEMPQQETGEERRRSSLPEGCCAWSVLFYCRRPLLQLGLCPVSLDLECGKVKAPSAPDDRPLVGSLYFT